MSLRGARRPNNGFHRDGCAGGTRRTERDVGAAYICLLRYPLDPADHVWQAIPIGFATYGVLFAITLFVRRQARWEATR